MADEETEVPAMKKYLEHLEMLDKTHEYAAKSWRRTIKDVANWKDMQLYLQKKYGVAPKPDSKAETRAVIPSRLGRLKNRLGEKWRNLAYGGLGGRFFFQDKVEDYKELPGFNVSDKFLREYDAKKAREREEFDKVPLEELEKYNPNESKPPAIRKESRYMGGSGKAHYGELIDVDRAVESAIYDSGKAIGGAIGKIVHRKSPAEKYVELPVEFTEDELKAYDEARETEGGKIDEEYKNHKFEEYNPKLGKLERLTDLAYGIAKAKYGKK